MLIMDGYLILCVFCSAVEIDNRLTLGDLRSKVGQHLEMNPQDVLIKKYNVYKTDNSEKVRDNQCNNL